MQSKYISEQSDTTFNNYYIVCRPVLLEKKLNKEDVNLILNKIAFNLGTDGQICNVFLNKEEAKFSASRFPKEETNNFFANKNNQGLTLAQPILCLTLDYKIALLNEFSSTYLDGITQRKTTVTHYLTSSCELRDWRKSNWSIELTDKLLAQPQEQTVKKDNTCFLM